MKIPFIKSRNFNSHEVARVALDVDIVDLYLNGYMHGYLQKLREGLSKRFGKRFKGLTVTSSNRSTYNGSVKNAAQGSHHIWRIEPDGSLHVAVDIKPHGISLTELYTFCVQTCQGEIYLNSGEGIVHVAPVPMEDEHWIQ